MDDIDGFMLELNFVSKRLQTKSMQRSKYESKCFKTKVLKGAIWTKALSQNYMFTDTSHNIFSSHAGAVTMLHHVSGQLKEIFKGTSQLGFL